MINARKVRICVVGAGAMANMAHYPALASFDDVEIVGVIEARAERLHATCDRFGIPQSARYLVAGDTAYQDVLRTLRPDGVYVIGQPEIMYAIWLWCLDNGFPLFIEKPMGLTMHQAEVLAERAAAAGLVTQVNHQRRSAPVMQAAKERLLAKGPIVHGVVEFFKSDPTPMRLARDRMMDDGTHAIDTARWICGGDVVAVESHCRRIGVPDINWFQATLRFDNGSTCIVVCNWASGRRVFRAQMHVQGGYADVEVEGDAVIHLDNDYTGETVSTREAARSEDLVVFGGFAAKSREFIDSLASGTDRCSSPFRDTVKTMRICHTILAQALLAGA